MNWTNKPRNNQAIYKVLIKQKISKKLVQEKNKDIYYFFNHKNFTE